MKFSLCTCILFSLLLTGSAQRNFNRPHPLYNRPQQQANYFNNLFTLALLFGIDFNEFVALQAATNRPQAFGLGLAPVHPRVRQRVNQDLNALSALGLLDGPDLPDGPAAGPRRGKPGGPRRAGARGRAAGAGEALEGAPEGPPAKGPKRKGPRRKVASKSKAKAARAKK